MQINRGLHVILWYYYCRFNYVRLDFFSRYLNKMCIANKYGASMREDWTNQRTS